MMNNPPNFDTFLTGTETELDETMTPPSNNNNFYIPRRRDRSYSDAHALYPSPTTLLSSPDGDEEGSSMAGKLSPILVKAGKYHSHNNNNDNNDKNSPHHHHHHHHVTFSQRPRSKSESARLSPILKKKSTVHHAVSHHSHHGNTHGHNFIPMNNNSAKHTYKSCGKMWIRPIPVRQHNKNHKQIVPPLTSSTLTFTSSPIVADGSISPDSVSAIGNFTSGYSNVNDVNASFRSSSNNKDNEGIQLPLLYFSPNSSFDRTIAATTTTTTTSPRRGSVTEKNKYNNSTSSNKKQTDPMIAFGESGKPIIKTTGSMLQPLQRFVGC